MNFRLLRTLALLLTAALLVTGLVVPQASADNLEDLYDELEQIIQDKEERERFRDELRVELEKITRRLDQLQGELNLAQERLFSLNRDIENLEKQIALQEELIATKEQEIAETEAELEEYLGYLEGRMRGMYLKGTVSYLEVLFSASSFSDFISRFNFLRRIVQSDADLVNEIREIRDWLEAERVELEKERQLLVANRDELELSRQEAAAEEEEIRGMVADQEVLHNQMQQEMSSLSGLIAQLGQQEDELEERIFTKKEQERILAGDPPSVFLWPVPVYTGITSYYGWRTWWYNKENRWVTDFHQGIDIATPRSYWPERPDGTPRGENYPSYIVASASGTVSLSEDRGSYGYMVEIEHGGGVATRYAHFHKMPIVRVGDFVNAGDKIGIMGETGTSTAPHLHFEVLVFNPATARYDTTNPLSHDYIGR